MAKPRSRRHLFNNGGAQKYQRCRAGSAQATIARVSGNIFVRWRKALEKMNIMAAAAAAERSIFS